MNELEKTLPGRIKVDGVKKKKTYVFQSSE
jgi:hypothetical protein